MVTVSLFPFLPFNLVQLRMINIKKGLDLPISGGPQQVIHDAPAIKSVAILGEEYIGMRPTMHVRVGDTVKKGQVVFVDKKNPGVKYTAFASGVVKEVNRGAQRVLQSVVIDIDGDDSIEFPSYSSQQIASLERETVVNNLVDSGLWTALRTRPFSRVPAIDSVPSSIFVTAIDTNPLAADPAIIIEEQKQAFIDGLTVLSRLSDKTYVCKSSASTIDTGNVAGVESKEFGGVHPAGLVGTHIHFVDPVGVNKTVWHLGYQDVIAFGKLFTDGKLYTDRVVSLAGPVVKNPCLVRTRLGANTAELTNGKLEDGTHRVISGSILAGHAAVGPVTYLGRYHNQISVLEEGTEKELFGWLKPGSDKFSITRAYLSHLSPKKLFGFTTSTGGSDRAMVPIGNYERVIPLDIIPTVLLRDLIVGDTDRAIQLGCLELDEEDLALCTFVCPGKYEYGPILRECLNTIEKEGY